ncbi:MAG TPA: hypothetical protein PK156_45310, partial [Polyangium sp.]|nr:hypothetical protein [Polyangium sp.]
AVELSVDEAIAAGATSVEFTKPVSFYVENFLGMPVGTQVPLGIYDRIGGRWIPEPDGRVIKIVGVDASGAVIDSGSPTITFSAEERTQLATLYPVGTTLWRVQLQHFSTVDLNWPVPPASSCAPDDSRCPLGGGPEGPNPEDDACKQSGSIIECENQILGEQVAIAGTPYVLNYRSDRAIGRKDAYSVSIPITGPAQLPANLQKIYVRLEVAGRSFGENFDCPGTSCGPNKRYELTWDGRDSEGRILHGAQAAKVSVGYQYDAEYGAPPPTTQSFGAPSYTIMPGVASRSKATRWKRWQMTVGAFSAESLGLGGFTLDRHHVYDPNGRVLYRGDGSRVSARVTPTMLDLVASSLNIPANRWSPKSIVVMPDGEIVFTDSLTCTIRRLHGNGTQTTIAGTSCGFSGDGGPALQAQLAPTDLAVGPDGSLYVNEPSNRRVRRIYPNGTIDTVAGNGTFCSVPVEDSLAKTTCLPTPKAVAVSTSGDLFVNTANRVYRIDTSGRLTRFAGGGTVFYPPSPSGPIDAKTITFDEAGALASAPDGSLYIADANGSAVYHVFLDGTITKIPQVIRNPTAITVGADGTVYVAERAGDPVIRAITSDTTVITVAGTQDPNCPTICGVNGPALGATFYVMTALAAGPDGSVWIADGSSDNIMRVRPSLPFVSAGFYSIMNDAGTEIYEFDPNGKHLRTKDARTGVIIDAFTYDPQGRLFEIADRDGLITRIERNAQTGEPTYIVGPFWHTTALSVNPEGYLNTLTNPANERVTMHYYPGTGLLYQWTDAKNQARMFGYDFLTGRLTTDANPAGGSKTLNKTSISNGYRVDLATALGRTTRYEVTRSAGGAKLRSVTAPSGLVSQANVYSNGDRLLTFPDQTTVTTKSAGDPRFGLQAPIAAVEDMVTGTLTRHIERSRVVTMNPNAPLSLQTQIDTVKVNGDEFVTTFTADLGKEETVTPEGRHFVQYVDAKGRVIREQLGNLTPIDYVYDNEGKIEQIISGNRIWDPGYDARGHVSSMTNPLFETSSFGSDAIGRLTSETNAKQETTTLEYDANGNTDAVTPAGQPSHEMTYTPIDQLATYTAPMVNNEPSTTSWTYDADGARDLVKLPGGSVIDYTPDSAGRPHTITLPN